MADNVLKLKVDPDLEMFGFCFKSVSLIVEQEKPFL